MNNNHPRTVPRSNGIHERIDACDETHYRVPLVTNPNAPWPNAPEWLPGIRMRGIVRREANNYSNGSRDKGVVEPLHSEEGEYYFFGWADVADRNHLFVGDEVLFQLAGDDSENVAVIALERRQCAYGIITNIFHNTHIFLELLGIFPELSIDFQTVDTCIGTLQHADEITCEVRCLDGRYEVSNLQRAVQGALQPRRISYSLLHGIVAKPLYESILLANPFYRGEICTFTDNISLIPYGLLSYRNREEVFLLGDRVEFTMATFHDHFHMVYDLVRAERTHEDNPIFGMLRMDF